MTNSTFRRRQLALMLASTLASSAIFGKDALPASADPAIEARMLAITSELRCLVCQNQTIADSHAGLAEDLREQTRVMLRNGRTDQEVIDYMTARYGEFVLYRPLVRPKTLLLWFGPAALMIGGLIGLLFVLRRRDRLADDRFDPEEDSEFDREKHEHGPRARA